MIDIHMRYIASVFGNFTEVEPKPKYISDILKIYEDKDLIPGTFRELSSKDSNPRLRLRLSSPQGDRHIRFTPTRISVEHTLSDPKGAKMGSLDEFSNEAGDMLSRFIDGQNIKCNRISLIESGLLKEMSQVEMKKIYLSLIRPITFYAEDEPIEWNLRVVARKEIALNAGPEIGNIITAISRMKGHIEYEDQLIPLDRIQIDFDINSAQENQDYRLDSDSIRDFFRGACSLRNVILAELEEVISG